jgi:hypothetical protein
MPELRQAHLGSNQHCAKEPRRLRGKWTPALRRRFLEHLSVSGDVRAAAARCGLSRQSVYKLRRRDAPFARAWDAALSQLRAALDEELIRRIGDYLRLAEALRGPLQNGSLDTVNSINRVSTAAP